MMGLGSALSVAYDVADDGNLIVGRGNPLGSTGAATIWRGDGAGVNVADFLTEAGVLGLSGWRLDEVIDVSADGRTITGRGRNPAGRTESWVATIPEPSTLAIAIVAAFVNGAFVLVFHCRT
jgi:uncharacterized membrane protein